MSFNELLFYLLLLIAAFALLAVIFDPKGRRAVSTHVLGMTLTEQADEAQEPTLTLTALQGGVVLLQHTAVPLCDGENANLVATLADDGHLQLVEKKGMRTSAAERRYQAQATLRFLRARTYDVRFESEITGQWRTLEFTNVDGQQWQGSLKY